MNLRLLVKKEIERLYPPYKGIGISGSDLEVLKKIHNFIDRKEKIYSERHKYDLQWAFRDAHDRINGLVSELILMREKDPSLSEMITKNVNSRRIKRLDKNIRIYSLASTFVCLIDIIISLVLIMAISEIGHMGDGMFSSALLSTLFFIIVILLKVTLDRFYIIPKVHAWGWERYLRISRSFEQNFAIMLALKIVIDRLSKEGKKDSIEKVLEKARCDLR